MKIRKQPEHYPQGQEYGPWGVTTYRNQWYVVNKHTENGCAIGMVGHPARGRAPTNYFDRAIEEARLRNIQHQANARPGTQLQLC